MTESSPRTGTAFESLQRSYAVHAPRFEVYLGPTLDSSAPDRSSDPILERDVAIAAEQRRLEQLVGLANDSGEPSTARYMPLASVNEGATKRTSDVRRVSFTETVGSDGELAKVELEVHNVYDAVAQTYRYSDPPRGASAPLLDYGRLIALRIGYRDSLDFVFEGVITEYQVSFPAEGASSVAVTAVDRRDALRAFTPTRPPAGNYRSEEEALRYLVGEAGFRVAKRTESQQTAPAGRVRLPSDGDVGGYVRARAERSALELSCFGETLMALTPGDDASEALVYRYRQGLISFTPNFDANGQRTRVTVRARTPDGSTLRAEATADTLREAGLTPADGTSALVEVTNRSVRPHDLNVTNVFVNDQPEADQLARALLKRSLDGLITAEGELIGDPRVRAGTSLRIQGVGRFDGVYYVTRAEHTYGEEGYRTRFTVRRNTEPVSRSSTDESSAEEGA